MFYVAPFGRELQFHENGRVHIPSTNNDSWLCTNIKEFVKHTKSKKSAISGSDSGSGMKSLFLN
jgi:hypothetical protein